MPGRELLMSRYRPYWKYSASSEGSGAVAKFLSRSSVGCDAAVFEPPSQESDAVEELSIIRHMPLAQSGVTLFDHDIELPAGALRSLGPAAYRASGQIRGNRWLRSAQSCKPSRRE